MVLLPDIHTHHPPKSWGLLNGRWPEIPVAPSISLGQHPWDTASGLDLHDFAEKAALPHVWAIGEIGLDAVQGPDLAHQERAFVQQLEVAELLKKPVVLHVVRAFHHVLRIRQEMKPVQPWIVHGFSKNEALAQQLVDAGLFLSFGMGVLGSRTLPRVVESTPLDRLFLETDDSPGEIEELYRFVAQLRGLEVQELADQIHQNILKTFRREPRLA